MVLVLALLLASPSTPRAEADARFAAGQYAEASRMYAELLRETPDDLGLLQATGAALVRAGHPREAVPFFERELAREPRNMDAALWLATAYQEGNAFEPAYRLLEELITRDPNDARIWYRLGLLLYQAGYYGPAVTDLDRALALGLPVEHGDKSRAEITRAIALAQAGRPEDAGPALRALAARPDGASNLDVRLSLVRIEYEAGRYQVALEESQRALALSRSNPAVHFWRARIFQALGQTSQALSEAEQSRDLAPDSPAPHNLLVRIYAAVGRKADAAREAEWLRQRGGEKQP